MFAPISPLPNPGAARSRACVVPKIRAEADTRGLNRCETQSPRTDLDESRHGATRRRSPWHSRACRSPFWGRPLKIRSSRTCDHIDGSAHRRHVESPAERGRANELRRPSNSEGKGAGHPETKPAGQGEWARQRARGHTAATHRTCIISAIPGRFKMAPPPPCMSELVTCVATLPMLRNYSASDAATGAGTYSHQIKSVAGLPASQPGQRIAVQGTAVNDGVRAANAAENVQLQRPLVCTCRARPRDGRNGLGTSGSHNSGKHRSTARDQTQWQSGRLPLKEQANHRCWYHLDIFLLHSWWGMCLERLLHVSPLGPNPIYPGLFCVFECPPCPGLCPLHITTNFSRSLSLASDRGSDV